MRTFLLILCTFFIAEFSANNAVAQVKPDAKWIPSPPSTLGTGYYVVDSYDPVPLPWHPIPNFVDTLYQAYLWHRIVNGPHSFIPNPSQPNPVYWQPIGQGTSLDTNDNTFAGPINIGFPFNYYDQNYDSVYISSNGYIGFGNYARATGNDGPPFSYGQGGFNASFFPNSNAPKAIAAFAGTDGFLVHGKFDSSKVFYKTSLSSDSLYITFYGYYFKSGSQTSGWQDKFWIDVQICLTRQDSSITFTYQRFHGTVTIGLTPYSSQQVFENGGLPNPITSYQTIIGLQDENWSQGTTYMGGGLINNLTGATPFAGYSMQNGIAVQFRRWKNIVQADTLVWPPRNYELLVGDSIKPIAVYGNVAPISETFYTIFRIRNLITGQIVYEAQDSALNLAPGKTVRDTFATYVTHPHFDEQVGTMWAEAIADPRRNVDTLLGEQWPFDDTIRETIYVIEQLEPPFYDFNNNFSTPALLPGTIPNALQWVDIGAAVVDGEQYTFSPPPPRGLEGNPSFPQLNSPVILMDRRDANGIFYPRCAFGGVSCMPGPDLQQPPPSYTSNVIGQGGVGDTIISFPIDLSTTNSALLGFSYERAGKNSYPRWYDISSAVGPERTVIYPDGVSAARSGDSLTLEFANYHQVVNVGVWQEQWAGDGGKDFNFNRVYVPVNPPYTWAYFRFRVRLKAKDDYEAGSPSDDADEWFVDNFVVTTPLKPEIEVSFVRIAQNYPYLKVPASQAVSVPIEVGIANNGGNVAESFGIEVQIWTPPGGVGGVFACYDELITIPYIKPGISTILNPPAWNARITPQTYQLTARLQPANYDAVNENDSSYVKYTLQFDSSYVYDTGTNDIPSFFGLTGVGLKMQETDIGNPFGGSATNGTGSGTIATKFVLYARDTIYGVQAYFGSFNQSNDQIRLALYKSNGSAPGDTLQSGCATTQTIRTGPWDAFSTYTFNCGPIVLDPGEYWVGVSQLGETGFELGGNASRSSVDWELYDPTSAEQHIFVLNYPAMQNLFASENTALSGLWSAFYYPSGIGKPNYSWDMGDNPPPAACHYSQDCGQDYNYFFAEGSWIPMLRPYLKTRTYGPPTPAKPNSVTPVELITFTGAYDANHVALSWATASEVNNNGYYVERRVKGENEWTALNTQLVPGYGTTAQPHNYSYDDPNVVLGTTYQYQLKQIDNDGTSSLSNVVEVNIPLSPNAYQLMANYPNPFNATTQISYSLPSAGFVTLKIYDMLGREVRTLVNADQEATNQPITVSWDGIDNTGKLVPSGSYLYRMEVNGQVFSQNLSLAR